MSLLNDPFFAGDDPTRESITIPLPSATLPDGTPLKPVRQDITDRNPFREQMPRELMRRPGFGKVGDKLRVRINSHYIDNTPDKIFYQYDVSALNLITA